MLLGALVRLCEDEGLNMKRDTFEAEGRKHWGGTFCYTRTLCLGLSSFVLVHCYPVLRPYCLNRQHGRRRGSTMLFSEVENKNRVGVISSSTEIGIKLSG